MKVLQIFDHAFVLNLETDQARMSNVRELLRRHGIPFERKEGITASAILQGRDRGRLGCMLGHLAIIREARRRRYETVLVMEDDLLFRPNFGELWADVWPQLKDIQYDLFYAYRWRVRVPEHRPVHVVRISGTLCGHFYAVHSRFYDRFISIAERQLSTPYPRPIDTLLFGKKMHIVAPSYNLVGQHGGRSNISLRPRGDNRFE
jgi:GR25 family glycosyltransferase involved in LPS biosynthesis